MTSPQTINPNTPQAGPAADIPPLIPYSPTPAPQPQASSYDTYVPSQTLAPNHQQTRDQQILQQIRGLSTPPQQAITTTQQIQPTTQTRDQGIMDLVHSLSGNQNQQRQHQQNNEQGGGRSLFSLPTIVQGISAPLAISGARAARLGLEAGIGSWVNTGSGTARVLTLGGAGTVARYIAPGAASGFALLDNIKNWYKFFTFNPGSHPRGSRERREAEETRSTLRTNAIANSICTVAGGIIGAILLRNSAGWKLGAMLGSGLGNIAGNLFKSMTSSVSGIGKALGTFLFG